MKTERRFHLVLWGATGYTGRLVAEVLATCAEAPTLRWALGGRDRAKLEGVRRELAALNPALAELPILVGDASDRVSLEAIAAETRVVCTTVGPYAKYGSELVAACAEKGTDYCDLTGETPWMRKMIDAHHTRAKETGARIVHTCGFDSIPSDLGVCLVQDYAKRRHGTPCKKVSSFFKIAGGFSGGTLASVLGMMDEVKKDRSVLRVLFNPYALNPDPSEKGPDGPDPRSVAKDPLTGQWTAPFFMAPVNTRVVRRSNALLDWAYGRDFQYSEVLGTGRGAKGALTAASITAGLGAGLGALQVPPLRKMMEKRLPAPGEGPSAEERARGYFTVRLVGELPSGARVYGKVAADSDPGYGATSKMLAQAALCLAMDDLPSSGGVLTPASAMGMTLVERLRKIGMTFDVADVAP